MERVPHALDTAARAALPLPGFERSSHGRPLIGLRAEDLFAYGHLIRLTEQLILDQFSRGLVSGTTHTCIGQELAAMAVVRALDHADDAVLSNHRNHGHFLTYAGDFVGLVAEIMGREAGVCRGRGGSQHLASGHFHSNGVQGGMTGIGAGLALARKLRGSGALVATIVGDGTLGQGLLYESMNLASVWRAPLLVVVENNGIAQTTYTRETIGGGIEDRGRAFGLPTWRFADDDPEFCAKVAAAVAEVRAAGGPGFLVLDTRRMGPHSKGDDLRDGEELDGIRRRDPLAALGHRLAATVREAVEARNERFVEQVRELAEASPEAAYASVPQHIFTLPAVDRTAPAVPDAAPGITVRQAINAALRHLLETAPEAILIGQDLHEPYGGAFKVTQGLSTQFAGRVISTPISEAGVTGASIGLALAGYRPVMEVMFADFLTLCMDQLYNHAVKFPGVFDDMPVPLVVRTPCGGRRGYGPTHSQSPENLLGSVPGLTVVYPSHRHAVGRLLVDATLHWPYPVVFLEHKLLYGEKLDAGGYAELPAAAGDVAAHLFPTLCRGATEPDVTLVAYGGMLPVVEAAAQRLEAEEELAVEIVAPSLLAPMPRGTLIRHLLGRPRVVVVEESHAEYGIAAEVAACLAEDGFTGQLLRIGTPPVPIASARSLERRIIPDADAIVERVADLF
ncbi:MAG: 2-oxoglutarate dehydrogenase [Rubrivivax sp.]|nr:2-oxoglutarate dehydrogenase [Rubrivivax sp.]